MRQRITKYRGVGLAMLVMTLSIVGITYAQDPGKESRNPYVTHF